ncbi:MAG TPA: DUF2779 domain-containing protein [Bacteroidales bacterium]|nr:DUF2779 domain-containing protein [Bacteroidales bacterium]
MEKHLLSKSTFIRGVQCLKSLYLNKNRPFLRDRLPKERWLVFRRGHEVGDLAQGLFPGGVNLKPGHPSAYKNAIRNTQEHISHGYPVLYEAGFQHEEVLVFLDILVSSGSGWHAYEVKSSGAISDTYLMDAALQYYVIKGTDMDLQGISIIHIDKEYVLRGELDPGKLFRIVDVTNEAISRQEYILAQIIKEKEALNLKSSPLIEVGPHCRDPYDCDFIGHCWKNVKAADSPDPESQLNFAAIEKHKGALSGKIAFIKILTMRPAIPMYQGTRPYQEIAYGYALKFENQVTAKTFRGHENPEIKLVNALKKDLEDIIHLICLGNSYKIHQIIEEMAELHDIYDLLNDGSELLSIAEGDSLLRRIFEITGSDLALPSYTSDQVCAHHYLDEDEKYAEEIENYARVSVVATEKLFYWIINTLNIRS